MIRADYSCPDHGPFEAEVESPAPDFMPCPAPNEDTSCGDLTCPDYCQPRPCGEDSPWIPSAVFGRVRMVEAHRGKADARPGPLAMSTRDLGEGMSMQEWREQRAKVWQEHDHRTNKEILRG